jgi:hypothetical protein
LLADSDNLSAKCGADVHRAINLLACMKHGAVVAPAEELSDFQ